MKVVKQRFARQLKKRCQAGSSAQQRFWENAREAIWQKRFYDFSVWSEHKRIEKLRYMHRNPVKRGLVEQPDQWKWISFRSYCFGERGPVRVNFQEWKAEVKKRPPQKWWSERSPAHPQKARMSGAPGIPTYSDHGMFPTYSVYRNGSLVITYAQSSVSSFVAKDQTYQRTPSQIP
jgi:hypothetical protein